MTVRASAECILPSLAGLLAYFLNTLGILIYNMINNKYKRPAVGQTEEDILRMAAEFKAERDKNPNFQPAATVVREGEITEKSLLARKRSQAKLNDKPIVTEHTAAVQPSARPAEATSDFNVSARSKKPEECEEHLLREAKINIEREPAAASVLVGNKPQKSLFAQKRSQAKLNNKPISAERSAVVAPSVKSVEAIKQQKVLLDEIHENMLGDVRGNKVNHNLINTIIGDIVERPEGAQSKVNFDQTTRFEPCGNKPKSIFAQKFLATEGQRQLLQPQKVHYNSTQSSTRSAECSNIIIDETMSRELHAENLNTLSQMRKEDILLEREHLLNSLDPSLISLLTKKRETKNARIKLQSNKTAADPIEDVQLSDSNPDHIIDAVTLSESNPAHKILEQSDAGNWLNFNHIEEHKLAWMRDIPDKLAKLKPGQKFDARFDWKGVLLPHTLQHLSTQNKDDRDLYLHGEEAERPGYTLQEFFRLARSTVLQQRTAAFSAIAGILSIYNQGFYDQVLELPISKIFFLLRYGLDDNAPAQLEVVSKALARLCYNETDEVLLDHIYENAYCHWQPTLPVIANNESETDPTSIPFLRHCMKLLRTNPTAVRAEVDESEADSRMSMDDFQLAETDLIDCLLRTNIFQRISFILSTARPENSTVESCLKLLIRVARTNVKVARQLANESNLLQVIMREFLPRITHLAVDAKQTTYYGYPQYLCLKLFRVLISQHLDIAKQLTTKTALIECLQNYLRYRDDIKGKMIRVQIEALRILRCLLLQGIVDRELYKQFLHVLRQMLDWHYEHCVFEVGGPALIRQHAAALLVAIAASGECGVCDVEAQKLLSEPLHNCCCSWLHKATRTEALKDYTQLTLLSAALYAVAWFVRHGLDATAFQRIQRTFLPNFVRSPGFIACVQQLTKASIILRRFADRRNVHASLPNVGAILMNEYGPQLIVTDTYPVQLLSIIWTLLELDDSKKSLFEALMQPVILEPIGDYLQQLSLQLNRLLASNFFARTELKFVHQLLSTDGIETYLERKKLLQLVYNYLCCLSSSHATQIRCIFERFIFNEQYVQLDAKSLQLLQQTCMEMVYPHIISDNKEPTLTLCYTQAPILPPDWPYFQLRLLLNNYVQNVQQQPAVIYSEHQVVRMTLLFTEQLEQQSLQIVTPLEKLMYLMIAFMGPDSQFLEPELHKLLKTHLTAFYAANATHHFDFDVNFVDKSSFEPLYYMFVDHFQAASYGDELFSSLVLLPLAQKYDNKWRRRIWSEHVQAMRFINCDESLLIGGLAAYLEPVEQEPSLVKLYGDALHMQLVRPGSIGYHIAKHHFNNSISIQKTNTFQ